jgi:uncharacterized protein (UPF0332 family)
MPPLDPEELLAQARQLAGQPAQADLGRFISSAYYGLFHFFLTAAADMIVGADKHTTPYYSLVYRSVEHRQLRVVANHLSRSRPDDLPTAPADGFGPIAKVARLAGNLLELRHKADYDPEYACDADEASVAVSDAQQAIDLFKTGTTDQQQAFLMLLLFKTR